MTMTVAQRLQKFEFVVCPFIFSGRARGRLSSAAAVV